MSANTSHAVDVDLNLMAEAKLAQLAELDQELGVLQERRDRLAEEARIYEAAARDLEAVAAGKPPRRKGVYVRTEAHRKAASVHAKRHAGGPRKPGERNIDAALAALRKAQGPMNAEEIARLTGRNPGSIDAALGAAAKEGVVRKISPKVFELAST